MLTEKEKNNMRKFAGVLLKQGDEYLLQHRDDISTIPSPGRYAVWGGAGEPGESFEQTAIRELYEETGVTAAEDQLRLVVDYKVVDENGERHTAVFEVVLPEDAVVHCYEGQGIVRLKDLRDIPNDKISYPIKKILETF